MLSKLRMVSSPLTIPGLQLRLSKELPVSRPRCTSRATLCPQIWLDDLVVRQRGEKQRLIAPPISGPRCPRRVPLRRRSYRLPKLEAKYEFTVGTSSAIGISLVA